jgi:hypothetical protein
LKSGTRLRTAGLNSIPEQVGSTLPKKTPASYKNIPRQWWLLFSGRSDQEELRQAYTPRPRRTFLMLHLEEDVDPGGRTIGHIVREVLHARRFIPLTAGEVRRTCDFLHKIVDLIRGTGFSVAIFSDRTPARTLANIFFEIGLALASGNPCSWCG